MKTLIVPCGGKSTRFPGMRPKWLLTHPDGRLMANKALEGIDLDLVSKIVFVIVKAHEEEFEASKILRQTFSELSSKLEIVVLPNFTTGQAETVLQGIRAACITGPILVKDSDNYLAWEDQGDMSNFVVAGSLNVFRDVNNVAAKSFVRLDKNGLVLDIVEKRVTSETFCAGAYQFASAEEFAASFHDMSESASLGGESFVSHVIAWMIAKQGTVFRGYEATGYEDWGTLREWRAAQRRLFTLFCDIDGVLLKNVGQFGSRRWENSMDPIEKNIELLATLQAKGAQLVLVTARPESRRAALEEFFISRGIRLHAIITGCNHSHRILINDFAPTNPYPSCASISLPRDSALAPYLEQYLVP
jgi:hypothetical protein